MPTYDYECTACDHKFELFQSIVADPEKKCPNCKKLKLRRLIGTGAAVVFKGSGFYQTDYRSDSYKKSAEAETKPTSTESKTDTGSKSDSTASKESTTKDSSNAKDNSNTKSGETKSTPAATEPKPKGKGKKTE